MTCSLDIPLQLGNNTKTLILLKKTDLYVIPRDTFLESPVCSDIMVAMLVVKNKNISILTKIHDFMKILGNEFLMY